MKSAPITFRDAAAVAATQQFDTAASDAAATRHASLAKPAGSLGRVESLSVQLAGITGRSVPHVPGRPTAVLFAADHGVVASGVTPWPQEVTASMVKAICSGTAASSVLARQLGVVLSVVDVGVATRLNSSAEFDPNRVLESRRVRAGSRDLAVGPALTADEVAAALDVGASVAAARVLDGADLLVVGEMGIGNTTPSAAVISALLGVPAIACTGRGTGIDDAMLEHKCKVVDAAVARLAHNTDPLRVLAEVGGLEIAAIAGFIVGALAARVPVIVDGVITLAGLLVADRLVPGVGGRVIGAHRPVEPGGRLVLDALLIDPVLDLGLRLGEGTGALLAVPIVCAAAAILRDMATLTEALG
jgi:nicotinate-nucleotide--dimethylbenzimidazole phosphoribosyltransferase